MSNIEKYKKYFTKEYLMGPNSFKLLDELISRCPEDVKFDRTLDLGCGYALTSLFLPMKQMRSTFMRLTYGFLQLKTIQE